MKKNNGSGILTLALLCIAGLVAWVGLQQPASGTAVAGEKDPKIESRVGSYAPAPLLGLVTDSGWRVIHVEHLGAAEAAGVQVGDVVLGVTSDRMPSVVKGDGAAGPTVVPLEVVSAPLGMDDVARGVSPVKVVEGSNGFADLANVPVGADPTEKDLRAMRPGVLVPLGTEVVGQQQAVWYTESDLRNLGRGNIERGFAKAVVYSARIGDTVIVRVNRAGIEIDVPVKIIGWVSPMSDTKDVLQGGPIPTVTPVAMDMDYL